jgi:predicted RNA polymerase sigma factor
VNPDLLRSLAPQVLGVLTRRFKDFAAAEDAVQEALIAATEQWPKFGVPENPRAWLITSYARPVANAEVMEATAIPALISSLLIPN